MKRPGTPAMGLQIRALYVNHIIICHICGGRVFNDDKKHWDHKIEFEESQNNTPENLWPVHADCHLKKSSKKNRERRHIDRLEKIKNGKPKRARDKFKKKIISRGFPKKVKNGGV